MTYTATYFEEFIRVVWSAAEALYVGKQQSLPSPSERSLRSQVVSTSHSRLGVSKIWPVAVEGELREP